MNICRRCLNIFHEYVVDKFPHCPLATCPDGFLIGIDDQMADLIRGLWARGVGTKSSCSGHLYERYLRTYIKFDDSSGALSRMDLASFKKLLHDVNSRHLRVEIYEIVDEMVDGVETQTFIVGNSARDWLICFDEFDSGMKLQCQTAFLAFFYDVLDELDRVFKLDAVAK